jgi:hypothetical protein
MIETAELAAEFDAIRDAPPWETTRTCVEPIDSLAVELCGCGETGHRQVRYITRGGSRRKMMCVAVALVPVLTEWLWRASDVAEAAGSLLM